VVIDDILVQCAESGSRRARIYENIYIHTLVSGLITAVYATKASRRAQISNDINEHVSIKNEWNRQVVLIQLIPQYHRPEPEIMPPPKEVLEHQPQGLSRDGPTQMMIHL
jgi:hypothetical protein